MVCRSQRPSIVQARLVRVTGAGGANRNVDDAPDLSAHDGAGVEPEKTGDVRPREHEQVECAGEPHDPEDHALGGMAADAALEAGEEFLHADLIASTCLEGRLHMDPIARFVELLEQAKQTAGIAEPTGHEPPLDGGSGRAALCPHRAAQGHRLERARLLHHTLSRKGREITARDECGPDVLVAAARIAGAIRGTRPRGQRRGGGRVLRDPAAHLALGAWASDQSAPLRSQRGAGAAVRGPRAAVPREDHSAPAALVGIRVPPLAVEFWRSRPGRLHERELYSRWSPEAPWKMTLLNP